MFSIQEVHTATLPQVELHRLQWRCRRGLLENDLLLAKFFKQHGSTLTTSLAQAVLRLMDLPDNDLLDLFLSRKAPSAELAADPEICHVLSLIRRPS